MRLELAGHEAEAYYRWYAEQREAGRDLVFDKRHGYAVSAIERCPVSRALSETYDFFAMVAALDLPGEGKESK